PDPVWLQSNRLVLREFSEQDWRPLLELTATGAVLKRGSRLFNGGSEEAAREYVGQRLGAARGRPRRRHEIVTASREPDRIIGEIHLNNGWLSFQMGSDLWHQGWMAEAVRRILRFGFETLGLHRIAADCAAEEGADARVLEEAGLVREACFREVSLEDGEWCGFSSYALLDEEWRVTQPRE